MQNRNKPVANTMQTSTCECPSFMGGVSYGVGIAVGFSVVAAATAGILKLWKRR